MTVVKVTSIEIRKNVYLRIMQWIYVYFTDYVVHKIFSFKGSYLYTFMQYFQHPTPFGWHLQCDAYCVILTGASDLKLFVGGVYSTRVAVDL